MENTNFIEIDINSKEDIFNKFNKNQISDELAQYILTNSKKSFINNDIKIVINKNIPLTVEEQEKLVDGIREYFGLLVREKWVYSRVNNIKQVVLLIIGIVLVLLSELFSSMFEVLISELLLIGGWVSIWEMLDSILFVDNKNRFQRRTYEKLCDCEIEFK